MTERRDRYNLEYRLFVRFRSVKEPSESHFAAARLVSKHIDRAAGPTMELRTIIGATT